MLEELLHLGIARLEEVFVIQSDGPERLGPPRTHDFVRFVDVPYSDKTNEVQVGLQQFPIVERDLQSREGSATRLEYIRYTPGEATPWYRHWYVVAAFGAVAAIGAGTVFDLTAHGPGADHTRTIDPPQ